MVAAADLTSVQPHHRFDETRLAAYLAKQCVEALKKNPDDVPARERFARVLADSLGDAKTAIEQIELLLAMPNQPAAIGAGIAPTCSTVSLGPIRAC